MERWCWDGMGGLEVDRAGEESMVVVVVCMYGYMDGGREGGYDGGFGLGWVGLDWMR